MKVYIAILLVISAVFTISTCDEEISNGTCPIVQVIEKFNETKFAGQWYDIQQFQNTLINTDCANLNYTVTNAGYDVKFQNLAGGISWEVKFKLTKRSAAPPGTYEVYENNTMTIPHLVLDTNYDSYAVVWGCKYQAPTNTSIQRLFVYSRNTLLSSDNLKKVNATLTRFKIDSNKLKKIQQDDIKCGRKSSGAIAFPSTIVGIIVLLIKSIY